MIRIPLSGCVCVRECIVMYGAKYAEKITPYPLSFIECNAHTAQPLPPNSRCFCYYIRNRNGFGEAPMLQKKCLCTKQNPGALIISTTFNLFFFIYIIPLHPILHSPLPCVHFVAIRIFVGINWIALLIVEHDNNHNFSCFLVMCGLCQLGRCHLSVLIYFRIRFSVAI